MNAANRVLRRHRSIPPRLDALHARRRDDLQQQPVGIGEGEDLLVEPARRPLVLDAVLQQPLDPVPERCGRDRERHGADLPGALAAASAVGPGEERQNRSWPAQLVSEVEMVGAGIVEVHGQLHQAQAQGAGIEIEIPLRIARDGGDVMNAHVPTPSFRQRFPRVRCSSWVRTASSRVIASA